MLLYWEYCDQDKDRNTPVIASKYYKTLRNLEDCKCMTRFNGTIGSGNRGARGAMVPLKFKASP